uniref:WW domain-containing protein n=1 Tax=Angiostrongylus cantonensis TaxID=6313 RepID=A0A0K0DBG2_ANGCA
MQVMYIMTRRNTRKRHVTNLSDENGQEWTQEQEAVANPWADPDDAVVSPVYDGTPDRWLKPSSHID